MFGEPLLSHDSHPKRRVKDLSTNQPPVNHVDLSSHLHRQVQISRGDFHVRLCRECIIEQGQQSMQLDICVDICDDS